MPLRSCPENLRIPRVGVHPRLLPRSEPRRDAPVARGLVAVGALQLTVRDLEHGTAHAAVVSAVESDDGVMALATRRDELRILDLEQRLLEADELVRLSMEQSAERRQLHRFLLQRTVREEQWHDRSTLSGCLRRNS